MFNILSLSSFSFFLLCFDVSCYPLLREFCAGLYRTQASTSVDLRTEWASK